MLPPEKRPRIKIRLITMEISIRPRAIKAAIFRVLEDFLEKAKYTITTKNITANGTIIKTMD
jgi:hypothetical protein